MPSRSEVYQALDSERDYQEIRWPGHAHEVESWITYMEQYLWQAKNKLSFNDAKVVHNEVMAIMRKVTAMGVACMEAHGAPPRRL